MLRAVFSILGYVASILGYATFFILAIAVLIAGWPALVVFAAAGVESKKKPLTTSQRAGAGVLACLLLFSWWVTFMQVLFFLLGI